MKSRHIYPWKRFCYSPDGIRDVTETGYLPDPYSEEWPDSRMQCLAFEEIQHLPCLVLLGEPGSGKTTWLGQQMEHLQTRLQGQGDVALLVNLELCSSFQELEREVLSNDAFVQWRNGSHRIHLFLDTVDQLWTRSPVAVPQFIKKLEDCDTDRLCLRLLCRSSEWPTDLDDRLRDLYEEEVVSGKIQVFSLAPLRETDVREAVENLPDPDGFMREIEARRLVSFAVRPKSLFYLVESYRKTRELPRTQVELYETGCRRLYDEPNQFRRDAGLSGNHSPDERLAVASRMAALTTFCGGHTFGTGPIDPSLPESVLSIDDITQGMEKVSSRELPVNREAVREALGTQLFCSRGAQLLGWSHQTDAEFLAARYLREHSLDLPQILNLVGSPYDPHGRIPLQLRQVVSWLAVMRDDVMKEILKRDPEILLLRDLELPAEEERNEFRRRVVAHLLQLLDEDKLLDYGLRYNKLERLCHPEMESQLRPFIQDRSKNFVVRRVAISMAAENRVSSLQTEIAAVALDPDDDYWLRERATEALLVIGDDDTKKSLLPLARGERGDDPDDELKGLALRALWPDHISAEELFSLIVPPQNERFVGAYTMELLGRHVIANLEKRHLNSALSWVNRLPQDRDDDLPLERLADQIMLKAWDHFDDSEVHDLFVGAATERLRRGFDVLPIDPTSGLSPFQSDDDKRYRLVDAIITLVSQEKADGRYLHTHVGRLLKGSGWYPFLCKLPHLESASLRKIYADIVAKWIDVPTPAEFELLYKVAEHFPDLRAEFTWQLGPVELNSALAQSMKDQYERQVRRQEHIQERTQAAKHAAETVQQLLNGIETKDVSVYPHLVDSACWSAQYENHPASSDPALFGEYLWQIADEQTRVNLIEASQRFVRDGDPDATAWLGTDWYYREAIVGYVALVLLVEKAPNVLTGIPTGAWRRWIPALLSVHSLGSEKSREELLKLAYGMVPDEFTPTAMRILDGENKRTGYPDVLYDLRFVWDDQIRDALIAKLDDHSLTMPTIGALLDELLERNAPGVQEWAQAALMSDVPACGPQRDLALTCARALFCHAADAGWPVVWELIRRDRTFGRTLFLLIAGEITTIRDAVLRRLTESQLADLYIWLSREFPPSIEPKSRRFLQGSRGAFVGYLSRMVLQNLCHRDTVEAIGELKRLMTDLPDQADDLKWNYSPAKDRVSSASWKSLRPIDLLALVEDRHKRLVRSEAELLDVVMESIQRYQQKLYDRSGLLYGLWNEHKGDDRKSPATFRPKDELHFSFIIAEHLEDDLRNRGIVANREVQIRRGQFTDIHVEAVSPGNREDGLRILKLIIEVKGCWNNGLMTNMETQLVDSYLRDNQCRQGIYAVGWFHCAKWDDSDPKKKKLRKEIALMSLNKAQEVMEEQARALSEKRGLSLRACVIDTGLR